MQKEIKKAFEDYFKGHEYTTTIVAFNEAIYWKGYSEKDISEAFKNLVDKDDWRWVPRKAMIESCVKMTLTGIDKISEKMPMNST